MIDEAVQLTISKVLPTSLVDCAKNTFPLSVFNISTSPVRTKEGISHYSTLVRLKIVDHSIAVVRTKSVEVIEVVEGMENKVISDTHVMGVRYINQEPDILFGESDSEQALYVEDIDFLIKHKTK